MQNPNTSSPSRPPVEHMYFTLRDDTGTPVKFITQSFGAMYAAHHWLCRVMNHSSMQTEGDSITVSHQEGYTLTIKAFNLQAIMDYKPTKEEKAWSPPSPDRNTLNQLVNYQTPTSITPEPTSITPPVRHNHQKAAPEGMVTVAQLSAEAQLAPNKARNILRKNNIKKPASGWTYNISDPQVSIIRKLLSES